MNLTAKDRSRALEWSFRFGIPILAWVAVFAFFAFAGSVPPHEPVMAIDGGADVPRGAGRITARTSREHEPPRTADPKTGEPVVVNLDSHQRAGVGAHSTR